MLAVEEFGYQRVSGYGYDINVATGRLNKQNGSVHFYETMLISNWPTMFEYPNGEVKVQTNYKRESTEGTLVLLAETHDRKKYIQYL